MKTIKQIEIEPVFVDSIPKKEDMEQGKFYIAEEYKASSHLCLCGCGDEIYLHFNEKTGWKLIKENNGKISITPSIHYRIGCQSHYIITKNKANFV